MPLLPTELESLRSDLEVWYEDLCDILRDTKADDDYGGRVDAFTAVYTDIPCYIVPGMSVGHRTVEDLVGLLRQQMLYTVSLPAGETDVKVDDHLKITTQNNLMLRVQVVMNPESLNIEDQVIANLLV